jgi:hypothetical protein
MITEKRKPKGGSVAVPFLEKKIMVYSTVKRKYHKEAMIAIKQLCAKWR